MRITFGGAAIRKIIEKRVQEVPGLVKRQLEVHTECMAAWHIVNQYHFTQWQDHHLQPTAKHVLNLCSMVRDSLDRSKGACIVHCNDSIGRTGVFIALTKLASEIDEYPEEIDICQTVFDMRACRMRMVRFLVTLSATLSTLSLSGQ